MEAFKRGIDAFNRRDAESILEELDTEAVFHAALPAMLGDESAVYRGHEEYAGCSGTWRRRSQSSGSRSRRSGTWASESSRPATFGGVATEALIGLRPDADAIAHRRRPDDERMFAEIRAMSESLGKEQSPPGLTADT